MIEMLQGLFGRLSGDAYSPWAILFELLLIGVSVNWCASVLHGTRGTRLLRGLLVVLIVVTLVLRVLSVQTDWTRLELLYRYFIIGLAFIALVAFQPELRRALIRAGEVSFLRRGAPETQVIGSLVAAAKFLSRNRYGALLAIQREVGLRNWAENGTPLGADVSANLLGSIFVPNSPLHDLGVIIEGRKVLAANCQFPSVESGESDTSLGSRHRAAIGMSLESDALVLVISEETGTISLAEGGKLTRFLTLDDLEEELRTRLTGRPHSSWRPGGSGRDAMRWMRRLAVVIPLTLAIWVLAEQASLISGEASVQLSLRHDPGLAVDVVSPAQPVFVVTVRGPARAVDALRGYAGDGPLRLEWRLPEVYGHAGTYESRVASVLDALPALRERGLSVLRAVPETLQIDVDEIVSVEMPVRIEHGDILLGEQRVEPQVVAVSMRRGRLARVPESQRYVIASAVDRLRRVPSDETTSFDVLLDPNVGGVHPALRTQPSEVTVTVRVLGQRATRTLGRISVQIVSGVELQRQFSVIPVDINEWQIDVTVEGDRLRLDALRPEDVQAFISPRPDAGAPGSVIAADVGFRLPEGVALVGRAPQVRFRLEPIDSLTP